MLVFVTGAGGWIGSATVEELIAAGHDVVGLARSAASAASLREKGATALRGDLDDLGSLRRGAADAGAVVHLANKHDRDDPAVSNRAERAAVETLTDALAGTDRPLLLASAPPPVATGRAATEADPSPHVGPDAPRGGSENLALGRVERGVRTMIARFPIVHGRGDPGFVATVVAAARRHGVSGYVGDGSGVWPAVHRDDAARLLRLAIEGAPAGSVLHPVAEEGVPTRRIAEAIGRVLDVPVTSIDPDDALGHFGWIGRFLGMDLPAASTRTRALLGWTPTGPTLLDDVAAGAYTALTSSPGAAGGRATT